MTSPSTDSLPKQTRPPVFAIACGCLALLAVGQLAIGGIALAKRFQDSQKVRIVEKEVPKVVTLRIPQSGEKTADKSIVARPPVLEIAPLPKVEPTPLTTPSIAIPRSERLVKEAKQARIAGDMMRAITKLESALEESPHEASVLFELGQIHENMGVLDKASEYYEQVFQLGVAGAGSLYQAAAAKLRDGFERPTDKLGKLSLDRVGIIKGEDPKGQKVTLTIPVEVAPDAELDVGEISIEVNFFNLTSKGDIVPLEDDSWVEQHWLTEPINWADGPETLLMTYTIPSQSVANEHLFGSLEYYGQVVTLSYKGEVMDMEAWPRHLAARLPNRNSQNMNDPYALPDFSNEFPPDFDPSAGLLPPR
ncbi:hypothetical protein JIN85_12120 [Luteolibacter pohnpeiensis]|uniref:Tetratricopeptide repeat protein n=1 Tax=Luteolibacter pohnpeiensis TaxID=454153 RepID=A0A934S7A8_9BACT|nr:hypothetical protein [Luteolibacter pohnpeiensis]MBK1883168.1 hypothetical protein [Luteolibacter pohnpeiensis]